MMRADKMQDFLATTDFADWQFEPLSGDASFRSYQRGRKDDQTVMLMDAPPENGEDIKPFLKVTQYLSQMDLAPPRIFASDQDQGFIVMEDFGDNLVAEHCRVRPEDEEVIYQAAIDILAHVKTHPAPDDLTPYDRATYHREANLVLDWYCDAPTDMQRTAFAEALDDALAQLSDQSPVLVMRDYHAENLIWRPEKTGHAKLGLLDYQDALSGHPAYDLVSLIEDARRSLKPGLKDQLITYAGDAFGIDEDTLKQDIAILGAQRNLKIVGIFARLWLRDGKAKYPPMIPHVYDLLQGDLAHPATSALAEWCRAHLSAPTPDRIATLLERT